MEKEAIQAEGRDCEVRRKCVALSDTTKCWEGTKLAGMQRVVVREDGELLQGPAHVVSCTPCH